MINYRMEGDNDGCENDTGGDNDDYRNVYYCIMTLTDNERQ